MTFSRYLIVTLLLPFTHLATSLPSPAHSNSFPSNNIIEDEHMPVSKTIPAAGTVHQSGDSRIHGDSHPPEVDQVWVPNESEFGSKSPNSNAAQEEDTLIDNASSALNAIQPRGGPHTNGGPPSLEVNPASALDDPQSGNTSKNSSYQDPSTPSSPNTNISQVVNHVFHIIITILTLFNMTFNLRARDFYARRRGHHDDRRWP